MNKRCAFLVLLVLGSVLAAQAQSDDYFSPSNIRKFGQYLFSQGDYLRAAMEWERYLYLVGEDDSVQYKIGYCHTARERYDFAAEAFLQIAQKPHSPLAESARLAAMDNLVQLSDWSGILAMQPRNDAEWAYRYYADQALESQPLSADYFAAMQSDSLRARLLHWELERQAVKKKSPLLAAVASAAVPGLGKLYLNRPGDALYAFAVTGLAALVSYRAFAADLQVTGVITSGITLSFYLGGIYGSYIGAQIHNQNRYRKWQDHLTSLFGDFRKQWKTWLEN